jgi:hypothetical protein
VQCVYVDAGPEFFDAVRQGNRQKSLTIRLILQSSFPGYYSLNRCYLSIAHVLFEKAFPSADKANSFRILDHSAAIGVEIGPPSKCRTSSFV